MISRYNQHSPHSAQLLPEQVLLDAEGSLDVGFVLLSVIRDLRNADDVKAETLYPIILENISREARIMTDEASQYRNLYQLFPRRGVVHHEQKEYVSKDKPEVHTNTVEGFFSVFKRGMKGVYQHCGKKHLHRYLAEFDFRYSNRAANGFNDGERSIEALKGIVGKRLTYGGPASAL